MSTREPTSGRATAAQGATVVVLLALVVAIGLLLRDRVPGGMGAGFLQGAAVALVGTGVMWWRVIRRPERASTFERAWTRTGDERDDSVLTRALAVLGLLAFPLTAVGAVAIALGAGVPMVLTLVLLAQVAVLATAFTVISGRT